MNLVALIKERAKYYQCLACGKALAGCEVEILSQKQGHCTVQVTCANCQVSFVAVLLFKQPRRGETPPDESLGPITSDELLEVHERLRDSTHPIRDLLR